jgi:hypothetical protein
MDNEMHPHLHFIKEGLPRGWDLELEQGGESLKDAWYRISNAHHRCMKKYSTMILLRNFYLVGIGMFLILLQGVIFWVLLLWKHAI